MKKILLSIATIGFVGAAAAGLTGAFFSDTETSTGNTFTAGAIDLKVDSVQHYNGMVCTVVGEVSTWQPEVGFVPGPDQYPVAGTPCDGTWSLVDLDTVAHKFFNFGDVKPADQGESTVSLHIDNNPAWACVDIKTTGNNENSRIEPEITAGDLTDDPDGGELAENIHVFAWLDNASTSGAVLGDNIWQAGEIVLQTPVALSALGATTTLALADSVTGSPLPGGSTSYVGLGWCAGTLNASVPGTWTCDGSTMGNNAQTDSATTTVAFRVEQSRNNAAFRCSVPVQS